MSCTSPCLRQAGRDKMVPRTSWVCDVCGAELRTTFYLCTNCAQWITLVMNYHAYSATSRRGIKACVDRALEDSGIQDNIDSEADN